MRTSTSIINTLFASALFLGALTPASADRVFPPPHLAPDAVFDAGTVSDEAVRDAWYHENGADERTALTNNETQESSPYPSMYYFVKIRDHANDESAKLDEYRATGRSRDVNIADQARITDDNS